jgi:hypothetical protein
VVQFEVGVSAIELAAGEQWKRSTPRNSNLFCGWLATFSRVMLSAACPLELIHALLGACTSVPRAAVTFSSATGAGVEHPLVFSTELPAHLPLKGEIALSSAWSSERHDVESNSTRSSFSARRLLKADPGVFLFSFSDPGVFLFSFPPAETLQRLLPVCFKGVRPR